MMRNKVLVLFIIFFTPFFHLYAVAKSAEKPSSMFLLDEIQSIPLALPPVLHPKEKPLQYMLMNSRQLGLDVNVANALGETPLIALVQRFSYFPKPVSSLERRLGFKNKGSLLATLLNHPDVDLDAVSAFGYTALIKAIRLGQTDLALALLEKGASPNAVTDKNHYYGLYERNTPLPRVVPLIEAIKYKNYAVAHALITNKATDINALDEEGHTVLVEEYEKSIALAVSKKAGTFQHPMTLRKRSPSLFKRCTNLLAN